MIHLVILTFTSLKSIIDMVVEVLGCLPDALAETLGYLANTAQLL